MDRVAYAGAIKYKISTIISMKNNRLIELDIFKGYAIVLMVLFHLCYDLNYFKYISIDLHRDTFWILARYVIVTMFLLGVGMSLAIAHQSHVKWTKVRKRIFLLGGASALISIVTYIVFPQSWVYFGILHFILVASLVGLLFLPYPLFSLFVAFIMLIGSQMGWLNMHWLFLFLQEPLHLPKHTEDLVPFIPWFAVVLIGMALTRYGYHEKVLKNRFFKPTLVHNKTLAVFGRNALMIYLVHQPLFFGLFLLFSFF